MLVIAAANPFYGGNGRNSVDSFVNGVDSVKQLKSGRFLENKKFFKRTTLDESGPSIKIVDLSKNGVQLSGVGILVLLKSGITVDDYLNEPDAAKRILMIDPIAATDATKSSSVGNANFFGELYQINSQLYAGYTTFDSEMHESSRIVLLRPAADLFSEFSFIGSKKFIDGSEFLLAEDGSVSYIKQNVDGKYIEVPVPDMKFVDGIKLDFGTLGLTSTGQLLKLDAYSGTLEKTQMASGIVKLLKQPLNSRIVYYLKSDGVVYANQEGVETPMPALPAGYKLGGFMGDLAIGVSNNKVAVRKVLSSNPNQSISEGFAMDTSFESGAALDVKAATQWVFSKDVCDLVKEPN